MEMIEVTFRKDWKKIKNKFSVGVSKNGAKVIQFLDYDPEKGNVTYISFPSKKKKQAPICKEHPFYVFESLESAQAYLGSGEKGC